MAKITKVSPLAPAAFPELPAIDGVRFATVEAGVRYQGRTDVMLAVLDPGTSVAGSLPDRPPARRRCWIVRTRSAGPVTARQPSL